MRLAVASLVLLAACGLADPAELGEDRTTSADGLLEFDRACDAGDRLVIAAVGDLIAHEAIQRRAQTLSVHDDADEVEERHIRGYHALLTAAQPLLETADLAIGNLEVPLASNIARNDKSWVCRDLLGTARELAPEVLFDSGDVYTSYPLFNAHPSFAMAAARAGFDVLTMANNHALDRCSLGIDRTIQAVSDAGIAPVGTVTAEQADPAAAAFVPESERYVMRDVRGLRIAIIAATQGLNGFVDGTGQVSEIGDETLVPSIESARHAGADLVIVALHWGGEYAHEVLPAQRDLARQLVNAGADVILGSHPHVLQSLERIDAEDGRQALLVSSMGNFLSSQNWDLDVLTGAIVLVGVTATDDGVFVNGVRYQPTVVRASAVVPMRADDEVNRVLGDPFSFAADALGRADLDGDGFNDLAIAPGEPPVTNPQCPN